MGEAERLKADPIADEVMLKIAYYIRYKLQCWPKEADIVEMKRIVKSILVQNLSK